MKLIFNFYSDWAIGSGKGGNGYDSIILQDDDHLPFIPGKTIKGLLREAFEELYGKDVAIELFGHKKSDDTKTEDLTGGTLHFNSAYLPKAYKQLPESAKNMLFRSRTATRLDDDKQAVDHSLRKNQVTIPLVLEASVLQKDYNEELSDDDFKKIENAAKMLKILGEKRHRGLGRVKVTAEKFALSKDTISSKESDSNTIRFKCTVTEPLILVKKGKTGQNTDSLEYIPGNTFRGIVARQIADGVSKEFNDVIFNGTVKFGDAHLIIDNKRSYKAPFSFYYDKNSDKKIFYNFHKIVDDNEYWTDKKLKLQKQGFISVDNEGKIKLQKTAYASRMKSSRSYTNRSSEKGGLFSFHYIKKGQEFEFEVTSTNKEYLNRIIELLDGKTKYFGKSKTAEFGGAIKIAYEGKGNNGEITNNGNYLYAESNLCFLNEYGEFIATPTPEQLGVTNGAKIDWEKSQVKFRTYAPYNFHRKNWDFERLIIEKGSVFVFDKEAEFNTEKLQEGLGCFLTEGYGRVLINPDFLTKKEVEYITGNNDVLNKDIESITVDETDSKTIKIIKERYKRHLDIVKINEIVNNNTSGWRQNKSSQWARVYNATTTAKTPKKLKEELFTKTDEGRNKSIFNGGLKKWDDTDETKMKRFLGMDNIKKYPILSVRKLAKKMIAKIKKNNKS